MKKAWIIAGKTYLQRVRSGTFLILTFLVPILMVVAGAIPYFQQTASVTGQVVGYVDLSGRLELPPESTAEAGIPLFRRYADVPSAQTAVEQETISGYFIVPAGYLDGEVVRYHAERAPTGNLEEQVAAFLRRGLLPDAPDWAAARYGEPTRLFYVSQETGRQIEEGPALIIRLAAPAALGLFFSLAVLFSSGQMGLAVVQEKEQRAMEMIITSVKPVELVVGKILGMTLLTATQFGVWALAGSGAIYLATAGGTQIGTLSIPWTALGWGMLLTVPAYFLYAVLGAAAGIVVNDKQQAQQLAGSLGFIAMAPMWLLGPILSSPDGPIAVGLSLFPLTSPVISLFRMIFTEVPVWQLLAAFMIESACLLGSIWMVGRIFRAAMLMYGQALRPRQVWRAIRQV